MDSGSSESSTAARSPLEVTQWAGRRYWDNLELLGPFIALAVVSAILEWSLDVIAWLYDVDRGLRVSIDRDLQAVAQSEDVPDVLVLIIEDMHWVFLLGIGINGVLTTVFLGVSLGTAFLLGADATNGDTRTQVERIGVVGGRLPALLGAGAVGGLLIGLGLVAFVLPGLYLFVRFALAGPAIVIDGYGPIGGLRAGWALSSDQFWAVGGLCVFVVLASVLIVLYSLLGMVISVFLLLPLFGLALGHLYADLRTTGVSILD